MRRVLVYEEEWYDREAICRLIQKYSKDAIVFRCRTQKEVMSVLEQAEMDLIILSVEGNGSAVEGIFLLREIRKDQIHHFTPVIMIADTQRYELYSHKELHCYRYLVRPCLQTVLSESIEKVFHHESNKYLKRQVVLDNKNEIVQYSVNDICYIEIISRTIVVHSHTNVREFQGFTLKRIQDELSGEGFIQCHRAFLVNSNLIREFVRSENMVYVRGCSEGIPVGKTYRKSLITHLRKVGRNDILRANH